MTAIVYGHLQASTLVEDSAWFDALALETGSGKQ